jgi:hypothetical protein
VLGDCADLLSRGPVAQFARHLPQDVATDRRASSTEIRCRARVRIPEQADQTKDALLLVVENLAHFRRVFEMGW